VVSQDTALAPENKRGAAALRNTYGVVQVNQMAGIGNTRIHEYTNTRIHEYTTNSFVLRPPAGTFFYRQQDERRSPIKAKQMATAALARQATVAAPAHGRDDSPRSFGTIISSDIHVQG